MTKLFAKAKYEKIYDPKCSRPNCDRCLDEQIYGYNHVTQQPLTKKFNVEGGGIANKQDIQINWTQSSDSSQKYVELITVKGTDVVYKRYFTLLNGTVVEVYPND